MSGNDVFLLCSQGSENVATISILVPYFRRKLVRENKAVTLRQGQKGREREMDLLPMGPALPLLLLLSPSLLPKLAGAGFCNQSPDQYGREGKAAGICKCQR